MDDVPLLYDLQLMCLHLLIYLLWKDHDEKHNNNKNNNIMTFKLIESEKRSSSSSTTTTNTAITAAAVAAAAVSQLHHNVQPPSDPLIASVLHSRQNPRPGRLLLENVNNRPQTMDRGTQANTDGSSEVITEAPTTSNGPINNELFRKANISVTNQTLMTNGGDNSSVDSLNSADSAKRDSEESVIELAEFHQPMIAKDDSDGPVNMSNGDGKSGGAGSKPSNGIVKEHPVDDDIDKTSCGMECLYFTMQCCECSIM
ncbi:uncharacterized protein LOC100165400 isoform X2 [Acyrthosiphon pisum]|uniref:Uncharacterized protein n=1 Tax=Acyrthosiphon pisum TaxID=7029 RepID=A0A8R2D501_ACYPI|nr:uncharacterized protein LOC100165400 isoform X2 [Acyrthosiphon pisum]|eukprot:XP_016659866.1 PREDICTED: uncharacterized protein LOC100165400 isoform X2 [Acyrthosiphon pisum]